MRKQLLSLAIGIVGFISACTNIKPIINNQNQDGDPFHSSSVSVADLLERSSPTYLFGKAKIIANTVQGVERLSVDFEANKEVSLLRFKNAIGIEALQLFIDADSITEYNKIDKTLFRIAKEEYSLGTSGAFIPFHVYDLFFPERWIPQQVRAEENQTMYRISTDGNRFTALIDKKNTRITELRTVDEFDTETVFSYTDFKKSGSDSLFARRIQIEQKQERTRILLSIAEIHVGTDFKEIKMPTPKNLKMERL